MQELNQQIAQMEAAIMTGNPSPVRDQTTDKNANYEWATGELLRTQVDLKALEAREAASAAPQAINRGEASARTLSYKMACSVPEAAQENYLLYVKKTEKRHEERRTGQARARHRQIWPLPNSQSAPPPYIIVDHACTWIAGSGGAGASEDAFCSRNVSSPHSASP